MNNKILRSKIEVFLLLVFFISGCTLTVGTTSQPSAKTGKTHHVVRKGENLFRISKYYYGAEKTQDIHKGIDKIKNANRMATEQLSVGQRLLIPETAKEQPPYALTPPAEISPVREATPEPPDFYPEPPGDEKPSPIITDKVFSWPASGKIICAFGELGNQGIDMVVEQGKDVAAADGGKVVFTGNTQKHKETIIIEHPNNIYTIYGNDIEILAKKDSHVTKGETVARIKSGTHRIRHLHFEIRIGTVAVNPLLYLPKQEQNDR